jgi:hypothetical protein
MLAAEQKVTCSAPTTFGTRTSLAQVTARSTELSPEFIQIFTTPLHGKDRYSSLLGYVED